MSKESFGQVWMAAIGMGGGTPWVPLNRREREALMLDAVEIAVNAGVDVNAVNTDGHTALDTAQVAFDSIANVLVEQGAKSGPGRLTVRPKK